MRARHLAGLWTAVLLVSACGGSNGPEGEPRTAGSMDRLSTPAASDVNGASRPTFGEDLAFLREHTSIVLLRDDGGQAQVAVAPEYQGRVMTSTAGGETGASFGYLHRPVIALRARQPHMTVLGGEDRFWLGPEGGQFALYFQPAAPFDTEHWQVPAPIDWDGWPVTDQSSRHVRVSRSMSLTNYAGTTFDLRVDRTIRLLDAAEVVGFLGTAPAPEVRVVAFESENVITNTGGSAWRKETGAPSIWILGMFPPGPRTTVTIPFVPGPERDLGPIVNDTYFGKIPAERLQIEDTVVRFRGDGAERGKIGVARPRARDIAGSYDPDRPVLTLVTFTLPTDATDYVNSMWAIQDRPYAGDVINSYNDGPLGPGQPPLGPFYEIESSSPAALIEPGASLRHVHRTFHVEGPPKALDAIARTKLGVSVIRTPGD